MQSGGSPPQSVEKRITANSYRDCIIIIIIIIMLTSIFNDNNYFFKLRFLAYNPKSTLCHFSFSVQDGDDGQVDAPLWMGLLILLFFTTLMAGLFCWIEGWDFGTSLYFQYITYLTIGFGDVVPQKEQVYDCTFLLTSTYAMKKNKARSEIISLQCSLIRASYCYKFAIVYSAVRLDGRGRGSGKREEVISIA